VKINPNGKQLVVYRVTTLLFPGKQPIACLKRVDVYNPLKAITVLLYRTTDQDQNFDILWKFWIFLKFLNFKLLFFIDFIILKFYENFEMLWNFWKSCFPFEARNGLYFLNNLTRIFPTMQGVPNITTHANDHWIFIAY
jgi:hypothetical protein